MGSHNGTREKVCKATFKPLRARRWSDFAAFEVSEEIRYSLQPWVEETCRFVPSFQASGTYPCDDLRIAEMRQLFGFRGLSNIFPAGAREDTPILSVVVPSL
ncbi:hypothetical protein PMIN06_010327 [Paraphaeosphaeria minitans]